MWVCGGDKKGGTQGPKAKSWGLDVSPLQLICLEIGMADEHMDSLSYGLTLGNMVSNRKKKKDLSIKSLSLVLIFPHLAEEGVTLLITTQV